MIAIAFCILIAGMIGGAMIAAAFYDHNNTGE